MPNVMILGAGIYQVPLIKKAQEIGLKTVVVTPQGNYPGIKIADHVINLDTRDKHSIFLEAKKHNISGILTTGTDVAVPSIGYVVDKLGLHGTGYQAAERSMNKALMKRCFKEHGVQTAKFSTANSLKEVESLANEIGFPLMVKAVDSSGSRGITKVESLKELEAAYNAALNVTNTSKVIVEQYLDGYEIGAQAVVIGNKVTKIFLHSDEVTPPPISTPIGHAMPLDLNATLEQKLTVLVEKAVAAIGIRDTIANVDIMVVDDEPYIIEIGARMGATCLPENISIYAGIDAYEFVLRLALGETPTVPNKLLGQANAAMLIKSEISGTIRNIHVPDSTLTHPDLVELTLDVKKGDNINAFKIGPDRLGQVIVKSETSQSARILAAELSQSVRFELLET